MRLRSLLSAALSVLMLVAASSGAIAQDEGDGAYAELLDRYVVAGEDGVNRVDYAAWHEDKADSAKLARYVEWLTQQDPSAKSRDEAFAYWVNLYNALTLKVILDNYPIRSIKDISSKGTGLFDLKSYLGPWRTKLVTVNGQELSLDDIEHKILRPTFKDPRVHYAVNCASIGCPNLKQTPWLAASLDDDLDAAAKAYINHPRGVTVTKDSRVVVSSIYSWFTEDFGGSKAGVIDHLRKYAEPDLKAKLKGKRSFDDHRYDWSLNGTGRGKSSG